MGRVFNRGLAVIAVGLPILVFAACSGGATPIADPLPATDLARPTAEPAVRPATAVVLSPTNTPQPAGSRTAASEPPPASADRAAVVASVNQPPPSPTTRPTVVAPAEAVTFQPDPGLHEGPQTISLFSETNGAIIRYTTDGTEPSEIAGTIYSGPVEVYESLTVRAIAYAQDQPSSQVTFANYLIRQLLLDRPSIVLDAGPYIGPRSIEMINHEPGARIRYAPDGTEPSTANGLDYLGPVVIDSSATVKAAAVKRGWLDSEVEEKRYGIYAERVEVADPITLTGGETLEIVDTHYIISNKIHLSDEASLVIRDSLLELRQDYAFQHGLEATGNSAVEFHDSELQTSCTGSLNWVFIETASLNAVNIDMPGCNTWNLFTGDSTADITNWDRLGATACSRSDVTIRDSATMEIELCFRDGAVVDEALPVEIVEFAFPGEDDQNVDFQLSIHDSSIDGWGIGVTPGSSITIRDAPAVTISVIVGFPWQQQTVELDGLARKLYEDQTWEIGDATLRLINTRTYGWEPNAFGDNTLIIRNSDYSGSSINSSNARYIIENSTMGLTRTQEMVEMPVRDSVIRGDVVRRTAQPSP